MYKESSLPLGKHTRFQGLTVRTRDWSGLKEGTEIESILGYVYRVGKTDRQTTQNKMISMLQQKLEDANCNKRIFQMLLGNAIEDDESIEVDIHHKRVKSSSSDDFNQPVTKKHEMEVNASMETVKI